MENFTALGQGGAIDGVELIQEPTDPVVVDSMRNDENWIQTSMKKKKRKLTFSWKKIQKLVIFMDLPVMIWKIDYFCKKEGLLLSGSDLRSLYIITPSFGDVHADDASRHDDHDDQHEPDRRDAAAEDDRTDDRGHQRTTAAIAGQLGRTRRRARRPRQDGTHQQQQTR